MEQNADSQNMGTPDQLMPLGTPETGQLGEMSTSKWERQEVSSSSEQRLIKAVEAQKELMTIDVLPWMEVLMDDQGHKQQVEERLPLVDRTN